MAESLMSEAISGPTDQVHQLQRVPFDKLLTEEWFQCKDNINLIILALKSKKNRLENTVFTSPSGDQTVCRRKVVPILVQPRDPALHSKRSTDRASPAAVNYLLFYRVRLPLNFCFAFDANFPLWACSRSKAGIFRVPQYLT